MYWHNEPCIKLYYFFIHFPSTEVSYFTYLSIKNYSKLYFWIISYIFIQLLLCYPNLSFSYTLIIKYFVLLCIYCIYDLHYHYPPDISYCPSIVRITVPDTHCDTQIHWHYVRVLVYIWAIPNTELIMKYTSLISQVHRE